MTANISNERLVELIQAGIFGAENLERLFTQNRGLITQIITSISVKDEFFDEFMQEAYITMCKCVNAYNAAKGYKFSTIFTNNLKWDFYAYANRNNIQVSYPKNLLTKANKYNRLVAEGKTEREILTELRINKNALEVLKTVKQPILYLDSTVKSDDGNETTQNELIADSKAEFEADVINRLDDDILLKLCRSVLSPAEYEVIRGKYWDDLKYAVIARRQGIKYHKVLELKREALRKLRRSPRIKAYYEDYLYRSVSLKEFKTTNTSAVERYVLRKMEVRERFNI